MRDRVLLILLALASAESLCALERKPLDAVSVDDFTSDTQVMLEGAGDDHLAFAWWIQNEYWYSILGRDPAISETDRKAIYDALSWVSLLAIVQSDVSRLGSFNYYSKDEVEENLVIHFTGPEGKKQQLSPKRKLDADLEMILGIFKPILGAAMGNMGNNFHF